MKNIVIAKNDVFGVRLGTRVTNQRAPLNRKLVMRENLTSTVELKGNRIFLCFTYSLKNKDHFKRSKETIRRLLIKNYLKEITILLRLG